ncbi:MAG TPA: thioredoxin family protein [Coleofasciculaceae cyanobacterium]
MIIEKRAFAISMALLLAGFASFSFMPELPNPLQGQAQAAAKTRPVQSQKPLLVGIHAAWCPGCKNIEPAMMTLMNEYKDAVQFVTLDVTDAKSTQESAKKAKSLGLSKWFEQNKTKTSTVAIMAPGNKKVVKTFMNNPDVHAYEATLNPLVNQ